jgi:hypothetical protein
MVMIRMFERFWPDINPGLWFGKGIREVGSQARDFSPEKPHMAV